MTDFPSSVGPAENRQKLAFALFRPVLFAIGAIGLALGGLVLTHRSNPEIAALPTAPPAAAPARPVSARRTAARRPGRSRACAAGLRGRASRASR